MINDLQSKTLEDYLKKLKEKNALEVSRLEGKDKSAYDDYTDYISLYAVWEKISNEIQRPTDRDAITAASIRSPKVIHMIHKETEMYNHRENVRRAYKEMLLVYLIIIFEEFLTNILISLYRKRPELLKSSQKSIK